MAAISRFFMGDNYQIIDSLFFMGNLISKLTGGLKSLGRNAVLGGMIGLAVVGGVAKKAYSTLIPVSDFSYFCEGSVAKTLYNNGDFTVGNETPQDAKYSFGFSKNGGSNFVGYANSYSLGFKEWLSGYYIDMANGEKPTGMYAVHKVGDYIGFYDDNTGELTPAEGSTWYTLGEVVTPSSNKILLGGLENNISALPAGDAYKSYLTLPAIDLVKVPEPSDAIILVIGGALVYINRRQKSLAVNF